MSLDDVINRLRTAGQTTPGAVPLEAMLIVGGQQLQGWTSIHVQRSVEHMPSTFTLEMTLRYPGAGKVVAQPGQSCSLKLGSHTVLTGWVDAYEIEGDAGSHSIRVSGRGLCCDLVDCIAKVANNQMQASNLVAMANDLVAPFKLPVRPLSGNGPALQPFVVSIGETCWDLISRVAAYSAMLAYEDVDGALVFSAVGTATHASGVQEGTNLEHASVSFDLSERFSDTYAVYMSVDSLSHELPGGNVQTVVKDPGVTRYRPTAVISPATVNGSPLATQLANYQVQRRRGRSQAARVRIDSWCDSSGEVWTINKLIRLQMPSWELSDVTWIIVDVSFQRDDSGTHATLTCMPPESLTIEPSSLFVVDGDYAKALQDNKSLSIQPNDGRRDKG